MAAADTQRESGGPLSPPGRDGNGGYERLSEQRCSVVVSEAVMPRVDGLKLSRLIRGDTAGNVHNHLFVLTAPGGKKHCLQAVTAGADDFPSKSCDTEAIVSGSDG